MTDSYTTQQLAGGAIRRAQQRLAAKYPFHARVLEKFRPVASEALDTVGVTARVDGMLLLYNSAFTLSLDADTFGGVLLHEVHHVVLGHLGMNPADYLDAWAFTVALEVSANEFIREPLPAGAIRLEQFPMLPPMESSLQRYRRLERLTLRLPLRGPGLPVDAAGAAAGVVVDDHTVWGALSEEDRGALADLVQQAALEAGGMPEELQQVLRLAGAGTAGSISLLKGDRSGCLDWRQLLRRHAGRVLEPSPVFDRPPRRFPELVGVWPGRRRRDTRARVVAVIDTSGSITDETLEAINAELDRLNRSHAVHVVECDCVVHRVQRHAGRLGRVKGRGGTDFRPALESAFLRPLRPDLVVYFTDGIGPAPEMPPPCPVIWCLTPGGEPPAPWGRVIRMVPDVSC